MTPLPGIPGACSKELVLEQHSFTFAHFCCLRHPGDEFLILREPYGPVPKTPAHNFRTPRRCEDRKMHLCVRVAPRMAWRRPKQRNVDSVWELQPAHIVAHTMFVLCGGAYHHISPHRLSQISLFSFLFLFFYDFHTFADA